MHADSHELRAVADTTAEIENQAERLARAKEIAGQGSFERSCELFNEEPGLLEEMVAGLQTREHGLMQEAPYLSEHDWQVLTVLELFDSPTFEHCKRTFYLAKEKIEHGGEIGQTFAYLLSSEGLSSADVLRACLLHDCGKMCLHHSILNDTHTDAEWALAYERYIQTERGKKLAAEIGDLNTYLASHPGVRPMHLLPFEASFDPSNVEDMARLLVLQEKGIDTSQTLAELIAPHQDRSGEILRHGNPNDPAADLVENHHPRKGEHGVKKIDEENYPVGVSLLRSSMETSEGMKRAFDILRIADISDAYHSERGYKPGHPMFATLAHVLHETERGVIDARVAEVWVRASLAHISDQYTPSFIEALKMRRSGSDQSLERSRAVDQLIEEERVAEKFLRDRGLFPKGIAAPQPPVV
jgi:hypothetical protein